MRHLCPTLAILLAVITARGAAETQTPPGMVLIPAGSFAMGDHHGFVDPKHGSDETPIHSVRLDAFFIGIFDVTTQEYCAFLNAALTEHAVEVRGGGVYLTGGADLLAETRTLSPYSRIGWEGRSSACSTARNAIRSSVFAGWAPPPTATG